MSDGEKKKEFFKFDPAVFISPPYWKCPNPKCKASDRFGVLWISDHLYTRRCKKCWYTSRYNLPKLNKKVIYLDQFAISNMMKVLNPGSKAYKKGKLDEYWIKLFERLDSLCKLQLIVCPESESHGEESLLSPYFRPLKRMYELLSGGISFYDYETIKRFQISEHARNWITGNPEKELDLDVHSVARRNINAWQERFTISTNMEYPQDWIDEMRNMRKKKHEGLSRIFKQWQSDKDKSFEFWFDEESTAFGRVTLQIYFSNLRKREEIFTGKREMTANDLIPSSFVVLVHTLHKVFSNAGVQDAEIWQKTIEYLNSPYLKDMPFNKISSMLYAAIARKAAAGMKEPPDRGMAIDIDIISTLLPYCDAMFIDKKCHSYLKEKPLSEAMNYGTQTFSLNNKEEFLEFLNELETKASKEHIEKVKEVYGKDYGKPFKELYSIKEK